MTVRLTDNSSLGQAHIESGLIATIETMASHLIDGTFKSDCATNPSNVAFNISDALGFTVTFQYGTPISYACLCRDEVALHLLAAHRTNRLPG
jgi:hypothetical protein